MIYTDYITLFTEVDRVIGIAVDKKSSEIYHAMVENQRKIAEGMSTTQEFIESHNNWYRRGLKDE